MSLDWNTTKVKDYDKLKTDEEWPITEAIIWMTMSLDIGDITEKNIPEWLFRIRIFTRVSDGHGFGIKDGKPWNPSEEDLRKRIGLTTNVGTRTRKQYLAKVMKNLELNVLAELKKPVTSET